MSMVSKSFDIDIVRRFNKNNASKNTLADQLGGDDDVRTTSLDSKLLQKSGMLLDNKAQLLGIPTNSSNREPF